MPNRLVVPSSCHSGKLLQVFLFKQVSWPCRALLAVQPCVLTSSAPGPGPRASFAQQRVPGEIIHASLLANERAARLGLAQPSPRAGGEAAWRCAGAATLAMWTKAHVFY